MRWTISFHTFSLEDFKLKSVIGKVKLLQSARLGEDGCHCSGALVVATSKAKARVASSPASKQGSAAATWAASLPDAS